MIVVLLALQRLVRILQDNYQMKLSNDDYKGGFAWCMARGQNPGSLLNTLKAS